MPKNRSKAPKPATPEERIYAEHLNAWLDLPEEERRADIAKWLDHHHPRPETADART